MSEVRKSPETMPEQVNEIDIPKLIADMWRGLLKYWKICLVVMVVAVIGASLYAYFFYRPKYQASAIFAIRPQEAGTESNLILYRSTTDSAAQAQSDTESERYSSSVSFIGSESASTLAEAFPYMINTNLIRDRVCEDLGISSFPVELWANNLKGTSMITLYASGYNQDLTYNVLVSVIKNYPAVAKYVIGSTALIVITPPEYPTEPINAKGRTKIMLYGVAIGFLLSIGWLALYSLLRTTVRTRSDIKTRLGQHTVGVLPRVTFKRYNKEIDRSILLTNPRIGDGFLEAMRVLRNAFLHQLSDEDRIVLLTSTAPGEGKSTTVVNLALSLADAGKKVLLIDGDIRNASVAEILSLNPEFEEDSQIPYKIIHTEKGYDLLLFDPKNKRRWNFVQGAAFPSLLNAVEEQYDLILIDTPPAGLLSDAQAIAQSADAAMYVVMEDTVRISRIRKTIHDMQNTRIHFLGCVLNGVTSGITGYGENYGYTYGGYNRYKSYGTYARYGYDHGYYEESDKKEDAKLQGNAEKQEDKP